MLPQVGHFGEVIEGVQASFVALDALAVCLLTRLIFLFIKKEDYRNRTLCELLQRLV